MNPVRLPNGNLMVPVRLEDEATGIIGDGMMEIDSSHPDWDEWQREVLVDVQLAVFRERDHPRDLKGRFRGKVVKLVGWHGKTKDEPLIPEADRPLFIGPEWLAASYAEGHEQIQPVEFEARNALVIETAEEFRDLWTTAGVDADDLPLHGPPDVDSKWRRVTRLVKSEGFDAIHIAESAFTGELGYEWVAGTVGEPQTVLLDPNKVVVGEPRPPKNEYPIWEPPL